MNSGRKKRTASFSGEYCMKYDRHLTIESNPADLRHMFGYSEEEMVQVCQSGFLSLIMEEEREFWYQELKRQIELSDQVEIIFPACRKDGTQMWVMNRGCYWKDEDGQAYIEGILVDVTGTKSQCDKDRQEAKDLHEQACKDSLTNLYNASNYCLSFHIAVMSGNCVNNVI